MGVSGCGVSGSGVRAGVSECGRGVSGRGSGLRAGPGLKTGVWRGGPGSGGGVGLRGGCEQPGALCVRRAAPSGPSGPSPVVGSWSHPVAAPPCFRVPPGARPPAWPSGAAGRGGSQPLVRCRVARLHSNRPREGQVAGPLQSDRPHSLGAWPWFPNVRLRVPVWCRGVRDPGGGQAAEVERRGGLRCPAPRSQY